MQKDDIIFYLSNIMTMKNPEEIYKFMLTHQKLPAKIRVFHKQKMMSELEQVIQKRVASESIYSDENGQDRFYMPAIKEDLPSKKICKNLDTLLDYYHSGEDVYLLVSSLKQRAMKEELDTIKKRRKSLGKDLLTYPDYYVMLALDDLSLSSDLDTEVINTRIYIIEGTKQKLEQGFTTRSLEAAEYHKEVKILNAERTRLLSEKERISLRTNYNRAIFLNEMSASTGRDKPFSEDDIEQMHKDLDYCNRTILCQSAYCDYLNGIISEEQCNEIQNKALTPNPTPKTYQKTPRNDK